MTRATDSSCLVFPFAFVSSIRTTWSISASVGSGDFESMIFCAQNARNCAECSCQIRSRSSSEYPAWNSLNLRTNSLLSIRRSRPQDGPRPPYASFFKISDATAFTERRQGTHISSFDEKALSKTYTGRLVLCLLKSRQKSEAGTSQQ